MAKRVWLLIAGVVLSIFIIRWIDRHMDGQPAGNSLQHVSQPSTVSEIVDGWKHTGKFRYAVESVLADTIFFIPCYSLLLYLLLLSTLPPGLHRFSYLGLLAGVLDLCENAGIFTEMFATSSVAPVTHLFSLAKWAVATIALLLWLFYARDWFKRLYALCLPIRFVVIDLVVLAGALLLSDQGWDILRALIEDNAPQEHYNLRLAAFLIISSLLALTVWFWSRHLLRYRPNVNIANPARDRVTEPVLEDSESQWLFEWLPRILGLLVFVIEIFAIRQVGQQYRDGSSPQRFTVTIVWLVILAIVYALFVIQRRNMFGLTQVGNVTTVTTWKAFSRSTHVVLVLSLVIEIGLFIWALVCPVSWWVLGACAVLVLTISVWLPLGSVMVALGERLRIPVLTLLLIEGALVSPYSDNHVIRELHGNSARVSIADSLTAWYARAASFPRVNGKIPLFIVATEGGGIRAAYWTATVLTSLEDTFPQFSSHLFAISGVSGGAVGATVYDALLASRSEGAPLPQLRPHVRLVLGFDALSGTLAALAQTDIAQRFVPIFTTDRAAALERGWEYGWRKSWPKERPDDRFATGFLAMFAKHPNLPLLFQNGTTVEMGDRVITAPVDFRNEIEFRNAHDALVNFGPNVDLPLSTSGHMSARFTYISPAGKIPNRARPDLKRDVYAHVVDGGYFEVSAAVTASEIAAFVRRAHPDVEPYVIIVDYQQTPCDDACGPTEPKSGPPSQPYCAAYGVQGPPPPSKVERYLNEVLSPIRAVFNARDARGQQAVGDVSTAMKGPDGSHAIEFRLVKRTVPLPLGWVLSNQAMEAIDCAVACDPNNRKAASLLGSLLGSTVTTIQCGTKSYNLPPPVPLQCDRGGCRPQDPKSSVYSDE